MQKKLQKKDEGEKSKPTEVEVSNVEEEDDDDEEISGTKESDEQNSKP